MEQGDIALAEGGFHGYSRDSQAHDSGTTGDRVVDPRGYLLHAEKDI